MTVRRTEWLRLTSASLNIIANGYTVNLSGENKATKFVSESVFHATLDDALADIKRAASSVQKPYLDAPALPTDK